MCSTRKSGLAMEMRHAGWRREQPTAPRLNRKHSQSTQVEALLSPALKVLQLQVACGQPLIA
ncbi:hypothetical protein QR685DRAFT_520595 [Neurospora intermedia]|uniref:Uncharacterized protein n=1 Tax=Neurospora intermedia TaxID=5142 RepID=A0ABR3DGZ1_NEUIN